jgi:hypothetical protein
LKVTLRCHISLLSQEPRYGIDELAERGGVSRRTVRYYVQRGLLPTQPPCARAWKASPALLEGSIVAAALAVERHDR